MPNENHAKKKSLSRVTIQPFKRKDQDSVRRLVLGVLSEFGYKYSPEYDLDLGNIQSIYLEPGGCFWAAKDGQQVVGTIGVIKQSNDIAELKRLYVDKEYRGQGLGRQLVNQALEFCQSSGFQKVVFDTEKRFTAAVKLYKETGFKEVKIEGEKIFMEMEMEIEIEIERNSIPPRLSKKAKLNIMK